MTPSQSQSQSESKPKRPSRPSHGITAIVDARMIKALEAQALKSHEDKKKLSVPRQIAGYGLIAIWALFLVAEFFHIVPHEDTIGHKILQWSPLVIGLALVAPDVIDRVKELLMWAISAIAKVRKLKISIPDEHEIESERK